MSSIGTGYDLSAGTFSPDGRIFQVEYANKALEFGGTAIGLRGRDGVVLGVEKLIMSKLHEEGRVITSAAKHIGFASAGIYPDARTLHNICTDEASDYYSMYRMPAPVSHVADRVSMYMHAYTLYSALRPFGCSIMLSSWSKDEGAQLYMTEPSGVCYSYYGIAIGKAKQVAKTEIEKLKLPDRSIDELVKEAARIIYLCHEETKEKKFALELSWVGEKTNGQHVLVPDDILRAAEIEAKQKLEDDGDVDT